MSPVTSRSGYHTAGTGNERRTAYCVLRAGGGVPYVAADFPALTLPIPSTAYPVAMNRRLPEILVLVSIFLAVSVALMLFIGPILKVLGWPS